MSGPHPRTGSTVLTRPPAHRLTQELGHATQSLAERVARCLPAGSFELDTFVQLIGVEETTEVPTASVTCDLRPRLRLNPDFVARHCAREEHLFLLVMHELWHVLLGHTAAYPRSTQNHNIAFDAVINAGLTAELPQPEYRGFFEALNPPDEFPHLLLRPPVGWPYDPVYTVPGPPDTRGVLRRLYPKPGEQLLGPTYGELLELIRKGSDGEAGLPVLLGEHSGENGNPMDDVLLAEVMERVTASWGDVPAILPGRGGGSGPNRTWVARRDSAEATRTAFRRVLKRAVSPQREGLRSGRRSSEVVLGPATPLPSAYDRTVHAKRALGVPALLQQQRTVTPVRTPQPPHRALVYLDVSGSMAGLLPHLVDLLVPPVRQGLVVVRQFSTQVSELPLADLASGNLATTGGTDIACVLADAIELPFRRVLLLTDGQVGAPGQAWVSRFKNRGIEVFAAVPVNGSTSDLDGFAHVTRLPGLQ